MTSREILRPKMLEIVTKNMLPNKHPIYNNETTQEASSSEIGPDINGDSFDISNNVIGLGQPSVIPKQTVIKLARKF